MQLNRENYTLNTHGIVNCTLTSGGVPFHCNIQTDEIIYYYHDQYTDFRIQRTIDEQYYLYQRGQYEPIVSDATFEVICTNEIVQLIPIGDVDLLLEDLGAISERESTMMSELA